MSRRPWRAPVVAIAFVAGTAVGATAGLHWATPGALIDIETSPDQKERVELYRPDRWQQLTGHNANDYAIARLSSTADGTILATSPPFYLDGSGATRWSPRAVEIGVAARYDRATGRWSVQ
ncbi:MULTISPECIES: hypothetical protein [Sphingomonas]|jgi:hypothetical protein|uniref:Uncharacterized protein n=1 Tax=Sphingomonas hankookensis TaxID=563996 RepID=A0ABR5Y958_9SPHN|nr:MULTISPECIES: hypothetical protein [Sphingomonas]KZE08509.1 hypothetical protein AVT10_08070 [Sphingomonas hankookensis]PZT96607.1 MAG: hypothetical protein DI625_01660 [Sphingomonas sp.]RSV30227.1 hypothetical protein CA237_08290 [Sphingomonas sp. ABOLH]WCP71258.1 hypothetical protein PPZ50_12980 [Sphingomonas hankookensis]